MLAVYREQSQAIYSAGKRCKNDLRCPSLKDNIAGRIMAFKGGSDLGSSLVRSIFSDFEGALNQLAGFVGALMMQCVVPREVAKR